MGVRSSENIDKMKKAVIYFFLFAWVSSTLFGQTPVKDENANAVKSFPHKDFYATPNPAKAGEVWNSIGPYGGDVLDIAVYPPDTDKLFAAAGVPYVSYDGGETWQVLESLMNLAAAPIHTFEIASNGVIYASGPYSYYKIFRSVDGGETWVQKSIPVNASALDIIIDPADPNTVYAGLTSLLGASANNVLIKSVNQGDNWTYYNLISVLPVGYSVVNLSIDPNDNQIIFAIGNEGFSNAKVVATFDGGVAWDDRTGNLPTGKPLNQLTISGQNVFIAGGQLFGGQVLGVYKSENYGQSWQNISTSFPNKVSNDILVDPVNPDKMYAASEGDGVYYTLNGGLTWSYNTAGAGNNGAARCLIFQPGNSDVIYAGFLSLGVCKSTDAALSWELANKGIATLQTNDVEINPNNPMQILVSFESENSGGCYLSSDGGEIWQLVEGLPGTRFSQVTIGVDGAMFAWSNGPSSIAQEGLYKSTDGGTTWENKGPNIGGLFETEIWGLTASVYDPDLIFIGGNNFGANGWESMVYRTINGGNDWENVYMGPPNNSFKYVMIDPNSNDETIYASFATQTDHAGFIKSTDGGSVWANINNGIPTINKWSGAIVCEPGNSDVLYGGVGGYGDLNATVYKSLDGGGSWNQTNLNLGFWSKINDILVSPLDNSIVYTATAENGVYLTDDGGTTWEAANSGLPAASISHFSQPFIVSDTSYFCASTFSSSVFKTKIYNPTTSILSKMEDEHVLNIMGNPSNETVKVTLTLEKSSAVTLKLYNLNGQLIQNLDDGKLDKGNYNYEVILNAGIYLLSAEINGKFKTEKIVIL
jgi:photosystem II stability/assembly factor-like uncharacterized protein